jgi:hemerythrin-like domain-containing protein
MWSVITVLAIASAQPTESFRQEHVEVKKHLDHIAGFVGELPKQGAEDQRATMNKIVKALRGHVLQHAEWEDKVLYGLVDTKAGTTEKHRFTASMRHEHVIVARWIGDLERELQKPKPDVTMFARKADNLLGLVLAHFECEEEVLLPVIDKTMTKEEFERAVGTAHKH